MASNVEHSLCAFRVFYGDEFSERSKPIKGLKERSLLLQNSRRFFGVTPFLSYKATLKQQLNGEK